jgi:3-hydroxyacyl-CoA dehydrogenase, NAD binding domain
VAELQQVLTAQDVETRMALITGTADFAAVANADIIIEAAFEEMQVKKDVQRTPGRPGCRRVRDTRNTRRRPALGYKQGRTGSVGASRTCGPCEQPAWVVDAPPGC